MIVLNFLDWYFLNYYEVKIIYLLKIDIRYSLFVFPNIVWNTKKEVKKVVGIIKMTILDTIYSQ